MPIFYSEKKVREKLAIPAHDFRRIRVEELKLEEVTEWTKVRGGAIALTATALERILEFIRAASYDVTMPEDFADCALGDDDEPPEKKSPAPPVREEFSVMKVCPNRHLLKCRIEAEGGVGVVNVWVPDNRKFVPKMRLKATLSDQGQYRLFGRCPRRKGRY